MRSKSKKTKNPIRGLNKTRFWKKKWLVELLSSGPAVVAAFFSAYSLSTQHASWFWWLFVGASWVVVASVIKVCVAYEEDHRLEVDHEHEGITACLHVLHATIEHQGTLEFAGEIGANFDLRATFHRIVEPLDDPAHLEQVVDYVGGSGGGKGRLINIQSGITGQAVRENDVFVMDRDVQDVQEYFRTLVSDWHFRKSEATKLTPDRFSAIAIPITSNGDRNLVLGVVYIDSKRQDFFNKTRLQECAVNCCAGLNSFIGARYD